MSVINTTARDEWSRADLIDHTFVDDSLRGQGIAGKLVKTALEEIQSRNGKVTATCSPTKRIHAC